MAYLVHAGTGVGGSETFVSGISDLVTYDGTSGLRVASISADGQWIEIRNPQNDFALVQRVFVDGAAGLTAPGQLQLTTIDGVAALVSYGPLGAPLTAHLLQDNGRVADSVALPGNAGRVAAHERIEMDGKTLIFTASQDSDGVTYWEERADGTWRQEAQLDLGGETGARDVTDMAQVSAYGQTWLVTLSAGSNAISLLRVGADGQVVLTDRLDAADGLPVATPTAVDMVTMGGKAYAIMAASGTSSITVLRVDADGSLKMMDQVGDDLNTRFQALTTLEVVETEGRVFVIAGGADDGLSLLTLLPDGRLMHLDTVADTTDMALSNVTGLDVALQGDSLRIFASAEGGLEITELTVDLSGLGDVLKAAGSTVNLTGGAGDDVLQGNGAKNRLEGGAGDDILIDGKGDDRMVGGAGADVFVLQKDGSRDVIEDFELGVDRLDLSGMGRAYGLDAFVFQSTADGIKIRFEGEEVRLFTTDGTSLQKSDFDLGDLMGLWRIDLGPVTQEAQTLIGTGAADVLEGGTGNDLLMGEAVRPIFDTPAGQVYRVYLATLDRAPAREGHRYWTDQIEAGDASLTQVITGFVNSVEFQTTYGSTSNADFVNLLFENVLGRPPAEAGLAYWSGELDSGNRTREEVVAGFSESAEFRDTTLAATLDMSFAGYQAAYTDDVYRLFRATLDRNPNASGLLDWARQLAEGTEYLDIVSGFVNSREFQDTYGAANDTQFVTLLYNNVLGRDPNAAGLEYWVDRLDTGTDTREEVVRGFAQSREFKAGTQDDLTAYIRSIGEDDRLIGGSGDDLLYGGALSDTFVFAAFDGGKHTVADLEAWDTVELQGFGYDGVNTALSYMTQNGADLVFTDQGMTITFTGVTLGDVTSEMIALL